MIIDTFFEYWIISGILSLLYSVFEYKTIFGEYNHKVIWESLSISENKYKITLKFFVLTFAFIVGFIIFPIIVFFELIKLILSWVK